MTINKNEPSITFTIPGRPLSKENKGQFGRGSYYSKTHKEIKAWEKEVGDIARVKMEEAGWKGPWKGRVGIHADFIYGDYGRKDITNYWKSLNDGLNGVVYMDDSQIDHAVCCRQKDKENPGVYVEIYFFDYMYHTSSAKRPDPWKQFTIKNVDFNHGLEVIKKQTRKYVTFVGKFKEDEIEEPTASPKTPYVNGDKRKATNGRAKTNGTRRKYRRVSKKS
jgi:Holliday junction resolvase RusA-like endonuclease